MINRKFEEGDTLYFEGNINPDLVDKVDGLSFLSVYHIQPGILYCEVSGDIENGELEKIFQFLQKEKLEGGYFSPLDDSMIPFSKPSRQ